MKMRTRLLPRIRSWKDYRRVFARPGTWTRAARHVLARHGLKAKRFEATFPGTCGVLWARIRPRGNAIVKLFPPLCRADHGIEAAVLRRLTDCPRFPAPRLIAQGRLRDRSAWGYLILEPREGSAIRKVGSRMDPAAAGDCARQLGLLLKRLHALPISGLNFPTARRLDSRPARSRAVRAALSRLRRAGIFSPCFRTDIARRLPVLIAPRAKERPVLAHGDVTEDHVLLARRAGRWRISGLIDFADAIIGPPLYEIMPLWFGVFARQPFMLRRFLCAYSPSLRITRRFWDRATAFILIHLFGPHCIARLLKQDRRDHERMNWDSLRDWLWLLRDARGGNK